MVKIEKEAVVFYEQTRASQLDWARAYGRLCAMLDLYLDDYPSMAGLVTLIRASKHHAATDFHITDAQFQQALDLIYPPLSGTSERTTEAPEG